MLKLLFSKLIALVLPAPSTQRTAEVNDVYLGLRDMALKKLPVDLSLQVDDNKTIAYGILMETGHPTATVTLTSYLSGDASLYFSTGGGILGGIGHDNVRAAAKQFVDNAQAFLAKMEKTSEFPLPSHNKTRFYLITNHGIYGSNEFLEDELGNRKSEFSPLFYAGQNVISAIRLSQSKS